MNDDETTTALYPATGAQACKEGETIVRDETWVADLGGWARRRGTSVLGPLVVRPMGPEPKCIARAEIAACAPEALRLLLEYEWVDGAGDGRYTCLHCYAFESRGHNDNCAWLALMRKAGLR